MIKTAYIAVSGEKRPLEFEIPHSGKIVFKTPLSFSGSLEIRVLLNDEVEAFRDHSHQWSNVDGVHVIPEFGSKIVSLSSGKFLLSNIQSGIWEVSKNEIVWKFNPVDSGMITNYRPPNHLKNLEQANARFDFDEPLSLLFSEEAVEFSRSELPFSAIACFTDHCDFDTPQNLVAQRELFKRTGIKVTKGFFRYHFSKREDNASYENQQSEIENWRADGHELAYHSLTQSIRDEDQAIHEFRNFDAPKDVATWIDHGYQPYNLSLYKSHGISDKEFADNLKNRNIEILWNYIDSGTSAKGVINQMNPTDFTLASFSESQKQFGLKQRSAILVKNIMFHFFADEKPILKYKGTATAFKKLVFKRKISSLFPFVKNLLGISATLASVFLNWKTNARKVYPLARYSPLVFRHSIDGREFFVFQTLDMIDFKASLCKENLDKLVREKGIFIAHTYFSAPFSYHFGRVFSSDVNVQPEVEANFSNLGKRVASGEIWNPTLKELVAHLERFSQIRLDVSEKAGIIVRKDANLPYRKIAR